MLAFCPNQLFPSTHQLNEFASFICYLLLKCLGTIVALLLIIPPVSLLLQPYFRQLLVTIRSCRQMQCNVGDAFLSLNRAPKITQPGYVCDSALRIDPHQPFARRAPPNARGATPMEDPTLASVDLICPPHDSENLHVIIGGRNEYPLWRDRVAKIVRAWAECKSLLKIQMRLDGETTKRSYKTMRMVWAMAFLRDNHNVSIEVDAPYNPSLPSMRFLDKEEKDHVTQFLWAGELAHLPEQLRLPYLHYTPNLNILELSKCGISVDDFGGILQSCPNLTTISVDAIASHTSVLNTTFPRKPSVAFRHNLSTLIVTSYVDIGPFFTYFDLTNISCLSMVLNSVGDSRTAIDDLSIKWEKLTWVYLRCWLEDETEQKIRSQLRSVAHQDIEHIGSMDY